MIDPMEKQMIEINGIPTMVTFSGSGCDLLCLHGWGANYASFSELRAALRDDPFRIIAPDFPGFGESGNPKEAWSVDDFANFVEELVEKLGLQDVFLLGHSHGGRVAIKLASRNRSWISRLYLCAPAGIRRSKHWKRTIGIVIASLGKKFCSLPGLRAIQPLLKRLLYKLLMVHDYERAEGVLRETMVKVINEDLTPLLEWIKVPTTLFWGEDDTMTPLADSEIMNKKIVQSRLYTFKGVRHRVHRDKAMEIAEVIRRDLHL